MFKSKYTILAATLALPAIVDACVAHGRASLRRRAEDYELAQIRERRIPAVPAELITVTNVQVFDGTQLSGPSTVIIDRKSVV